MTVYAIYDYSASAIAADAGRIRFNIRTESKDRAELQRGDNERVVAVSDDVAGATHYIKPSTGEANPRAFSPCETTTYTVPADGATALTLSQMRPDTHITVSGPDSGALNVPEGGSETITFVTPGTYTITAQATFPARAKELTITVTPDAA